VLYTQRQTANIALRSPTQSRALLSLSLTLSTHPGASLAVTGPMVNTSSPQELTNPNEFILTRAVPINQDNVSLEVSNLVDGHCQAGCLPEFGVLVSSLASMSATEALGYSITAATTGVSLSPGQSTVHVIGGSIAWVGLTTQIIVQLNDQLGQPYEVPNDAVQVHVDGKELQCVGGRSVVRLCALSFGREGHFAVELRDKTGQYLGRIHGGVTVVSLGWPIAGAVLILVGILGAVSWWAYKAWKRRRQRQADKILANYVGLGRNDTSSVLPQDFLEASVGDEPCVIDKSFLIPFSHIDLRRDIAGGASGKVSLGTWRGVSVAVKRLYMHLEEEGRQAFIKEVAVHKSLRHPNVVLLLGVCTNPLCMVLEFMERGSLFACLQEKETELPWPLRLRFAIDVVRGMA